VRKKMRTAYATENEPNAEAERLCATMMTASAGHARVSPRMRSKVTESLQCGSCVVWTPSRSTRRPFEQIASAGDTIRLGFEKC
jgi:hypothetical protein